MHLALAKEKALAIQKRLAPYCLEGYCQIAGSIRRDKPDVHDIELVAILHDNFTCPTIPPQNNGDHTPPSLTYWSPTTAG